MELDLQNHQEFINKYLKDTFYDRCLKSGMNTIIKDVKTIGMFNFLRTLYDENLGEELDFIGIKEESYYSKILSKLRVENKYPILFDEIDLLNIKKIIEFNPNHIDKNLTTPFCYYCYLQKFEEAYNLLMKYDLENVDLKRKSTGWSAFMYCCYNSGKSKYAEKIVIKLLENYDIDVNQTDGIPILIYCCLKSRNLSSNKIIKLLIENGADVNKQSNDGMTALMLACRYAKTESTVETIKILLENGADITIENNLNMTATSYTIYGISKGESCNDVLFLIKSYLE